MTRRFEYVKVGDQLQRATSWGRAQRWNGETNQWEECRPTRGGEAMAIYAVVTDLWFDPVAGQHRKGSGQMVAIQQIGPDGKPRSRKEAHTIRGLASYGYRYAERDVVEMFERRAAAIREGAVVGIGYAHAIRRRPKIPGGGGRL